MRALTLLGATAVVLLGGCKKTADGEYEVQRPTIGVETDTVRINTPDVDVGTKRDTVVLDRPTVDVDPPRNP